MTIAVTSGYSALITGEGVGTPTIVAAVSGKKPIILGWSLRIRGNSALATLQLGFSTGPLYPAMMTWPLESAAPAGVQPINVWTVTGVKMDGAVGDGIVASIAGAGSAVDGFLLYALI